MQRMMMFGLMLLAVVALSAVAVSAASAQGPFYRVNGNTLKNGETRLLLATIKPGSSFVLKSTGAGITITCKGLNLPEADQMQIQGVAAGNGGVSKEVIEFTSCTQEGNGEGCTINEGKIKTQPVLNLLGWGNAQETGQVLVLFEPEVGRSFVTIPFVGGVKCTFPSTLVEGTVIAGAQVGGAPLLAGQNIETLHGEVKFPHPQLILVLQNSTFKHIKGGLKAFGVASTLEGTALLTVDEGGVPVKWGVFS